jgi:hypothetical protein
MRQKNIRNPSGVRSRIVSMSCLGVIVVKSVVFSVWPGSGVIVTDIMEKDVSSSNSSLFICLYRGI